MDTQELLKKRLREAAPRSQGKRRWLFVPHDQLSAAIGPLSREDPSSLGIVLVEWTAWARRRPHHKQKLALVWANQRWFALEQAARGVAVRYLPTRRPLAEVLGEQARELGGLEMMEAAEREMRVELRPLVDSGALRVLPHEGWLTTRADFARLKAPYRMDAFYRAVRQRTGILIDGESPLGGRYSFDGDNREKWQGLPPAPDPPTFPMDDIKREVCAFIERDHARHPGTLDPASLPATHADAEALWQWALADCMKHFGPYEDAMSTRSSGLFHTRVSALMNVHRILPARVVADVEAADLPLNSKEGFIRQVLGWREFVRHVHDATDGFRQLGKERVPVAPTPGDGGFARWAGEPWPQASVPEGVDGGAMPSHFDASEPLPPAYWGAESGLACVDRVVTDVWREAWSHHITRLMVLSNLATLLDVSPRQLTDWFWVAYADAWDWVVEPNVLGMGTYAAGGVMTTKPYVAGSAYIDKMSDYCVTCAFNPKVDCPFTRLYWAFFARHEKKLEGNQRVAMPVRSLRQRAPAQREHDERVFAITRETLAAGRRLEPGDFPPPPQGTKNR